MQLLVDEKHYDGLEKCRIEKRSAIFYYTAYIDFFFFVDVNNKKTVYT